MADIFTKSKRSQLMSKIRGKNTKPEIVVRQHLFSKGFRFRVHQKIIHGCPDIVLKKYKTIIFVNGCFWHSHASLKCKAATIPKTNTKFWKNKIENNRLRDLKNQRVLKRVGWKVIVVWECDLRGEKKIKTLQKIVSKILKRQVS